jgi:hypothetical protein
MNREAMTFCDCCHAETHICETCWIDLRMLVAKDDRMKEPSQ